MEPDERERVRLALAALFLAAAIVRNGNNPSIDAAIRVADELLRAVSL
jgi:hypothetical protein